MGPKGRRRAKRSNFVHMMASGGRPAARSAARPGSDYRVGMAEGPSRSFAGRARITAATSGVALLRAPARGVPPPASLATRADTGVRPSLAARVALAVMVLAALALVVVLAGGPSPLVPPSRATSAGWMVGPFGGLASGIADQTDLLYGVVSGLVLVMAACYAVVLWRAQRVPARWVIAAIVALHAVLALGPPFSLTDVFNYVGYARLGAVHHLNPYVHVPAAVPSDPAYPLATWHSLSTPYGPLFTLLTYALAPLGVHGSYWAIKVLTVLASLGSLLLIGKIASRSGRPWVPAVALVGLNPLVTVWGLGGVHNDALFVALIVAAVLLLDVRRDALGGAVLALAPAVKVSAGLVAFFALLGHRGRPRVGLGMLAAGAGMAAISLATFGFHGPQLTGQTGLVASLSPANLLGLALGLGGLTDGLKLALQMGLAVTLADLGWRTWRGADWRETAGWGMLALILSQGWVMPWYAIWVLPLAAVGSRIALKRAALVLTAFFVLASLPSTATILASLRADPSDTVLGQRHLEQVRDLLR
jgi:hypothetical protein